MYKQIHISSGVNSKLMIEFDPQVEGYLAVAKEFEDIGGTKLKFKELPHPFQPWSTRHRDIRRRTPKVSGWCSIVPLSSLDAFANVMTISSFRSLIKIENNKWNEKIALGFRPNKGFSLLKVITNFTLTIPPKFHLRCFIYQVADSWSNMTMNNPRIVFCSGYAVDDRKISTYKVIKWLNGYPDLAIEISRFNSFLD